MEDFSGREIKGYVLESLIGEGGFGAVYRAYQSIVDREVAIKIILPMFANDPEFIRRFETEAQLVARLEHPHMVPLYDFWRGADGAFLVMRYLRGGSLRDALAKAGHFEPHEVSRILTQIASALTVAHRQGVIHRDLKPGNILLDLDGNAYLSDFGIAKNLEQETEITQADLVIGSPAYLSPEQVRSEPVTPQSDIYSLGNVLYELLTGVHPFPNVAPTGLLFKHLNDPLPALQEHSPDLPEELNQVIQQATAKDPAQRFADVWSLAVAFRRAIREAGLEAATDSNAPLVHTTGHFSAIDTSAFPTVLENPYKGLQAFEEADAADFFGRDELINRLISHFSRQADAPSKFLAIVGASGSGKSSVVKAGLIPRLRAGALPNTNRWFYAEMVPGTDPFEELEAALLQVAVNPPESLINQLEDNERGLIRAIKRILPDDETELFLFIDQFEELFTLIEDEARRAAFLKILAVALRDIRCRLRVVITLRADYYDRPLLYTDFGEIVRENTEIILPLSPDELEQAIAAPAERVGVSFETGLISAIVAEVNNQPGALPLLQYALRELFERRQDHSLTLEAYHNTGGTLGALTHRADQIYESLTEEEAQVARQIFLRLVTLTEDGDATRRRMTLKELDSIDVDRKIADRVIAMFGNHRLLTFDHDPITRTPTIEVAHEALIRGWEQLQEWLDESREDLLLHRRLAAEAADWIKANRDSSFLVRGTRLEQYEIWIENNDFVLSKDEQEFFDASIAARLAREAQEAARQRREEELRKRAANRLRTLVVVMVIATVVSAGLAVTALNSQTRAEERRKIAERNAREARSLVQAAGAQQAVDNRNPDVAMALVLFANDMDAPPAQSQSILADVAYPAGTRRRFVFDQDGAAERIIDDAILSVDGRYVLSSASDGLIHLWDIEAEEIVQTIGQRNIRADTVALSPDGTLAMVNAGPILQLWSLEDGQLIRSFRGHASRILDIRFEHGGQRAFSASTDGTIRMWDVNTGDQLRLFTEHRGSVVSLALSADDSRLVSGGSDNTVRIWDAQTGEMLQLLEGFVSTINAVDVSSDGQFVLVGTANGSITLWDAISGDLVQEFNGHTGSISGLAFGPNEELAVSSSFDRSIIIWDVASGRIVRRLFGHSDRVSAIDFSSDGQTILSGSWDGSLRLWDVRHGALLNTFVGHQDRILSVAMTSDTSLVVSGSRDRSVMVWDANTGQPVHTFLEHSDNVTGVALNPEGTQVVSSDRDGNVLLWDIQSGEVLRRFEHDAPVDSVAFDPTGRLIASGSDDAFVVLWEAATGSEIRRFVGHQDRVVSIAFNPDGSQFVTGSRDDTSIIWDVASGDVVHQLEGHSGTVNAVAFNSDGTLVATASSDATIILWDADTGEQIRQLIGHDSGVTSVAFSPDGDYLLSGSTDDSLILWNVATGEVLRRLEEHNGDVTSVVFGADGKTALSGSVDERLILWRIDSLEELIRWTKANRFVPTLDCVTLMQYQIDDAACSS